MYNKYGYNNDLVAYYNVSFESFRRLVDIKNSNNAYESIIISYHGDDKFGNVTINNIKDHDENEREFLIETAKTLKFYNKEKNND